MCSGLRLQQRHQRRLCAGVRLKDGETLPADLVIDASGRVSAVQRWLQEGGYALPRTVEVNAGVGYSGAIFDVPQEVLFINSA